MLKGAAAAGLYGSRAAPGVIEIRTRRGRNLQEGRAHQRAPGVRHQLAEARHPDRRQPLVPHQRCGPVPERRRAGRGPQRARDQGRPLQGRGLPAGHHLRPLEQFFDPGHSTPPSRSRRTPPHQLLRGGDRTREDGVLLKNEGLSRNDFRINLDHRLGQAQLRCRRTTCARTATTCRVRLPGPAADAARRGPPVARLHRRLHVPAGPHAPLENPIWRQTADNSSAGCAPRPASPAATPPSAGSASTALQLRPLGPLRAAVRPQGDPGRRGRPSRDRCSTEDQSPRSTPRPAPPCCATSAR